MVKAACAPFSLKPLCSKSLLSLQVKDEFPTSGFDSPQAIPHKQPLSSFLAWLHQSLLGSLSAPLGQSPELHLPS